MRPKLFIFLGIICNVIEFTKSENSKMSNANIQFLSNLASKVDNPGELLANVHKAFSNPDYLDKIFRMFEASDFPDRPWDPEAEKKRFQAAMLDTTGRIGDSYQYLSIILNKLNAVNLPELEKIYTMSESLDFAIDFYQNAVKAEENNSKLLASLEKEMEQFNKLIRYATDSIAFLTPLVEDSENLMELIENGRMSLKELLPLLQADVARTDTPEYREHDANLELELDLYKARKAQITLQESKKVTESSSNLAQMAKILSRHAFNINFQIGLSGFKINTDKEPNIIFDLDVVKRLKDACERVEGLRNVVLVEKDAIKKTRLEKELKEAENFLTMFSETEETRDQVRYIAEASNVVVSRCGKDADVAAEITTKNLELVIRYVALSNSRTELLNRYGEHRSKILKLVEKIGKGDKLEYGMKIEL